jgi:hypothetical protein
VRVYLKPGHRLELFLLMLSIAPLFAQQSPGAALSLTPHHALPEANAPAATFSPGVRAAQANVSQAGLGVTVARYACLPSFGLDVWYGIDANQFAARSNYATQATGRSALELVDAQTTAAQPRSAYDDGLLRYRVAVATLQNLAGTL